MRRLLLRARAARQVICLARSFAVTGSAACVLGHVPACQACLLHFRCSACCVSDPQLPNTLDPIGLQAAAAPSAPVPPTRRSDRAPTGRRRMRTPGSRWCHRGGASSAPCILPVSSTRGVGATGLNAFRGHPSAQHLSPLYSDRTSRTVVPTVSPLLPAAKVYKELFRSAGSAVLVDPTGSEWLCLVQTEARNDNRPQYTLRVRWGIKTSRGVARLAMMPARLPTCRPIIFERA